MLFTGNGFKYTHPNLDASVDELHFIRNKDILLIEECCTFFGIHDNNNNLLLYPCFLL